MENQVSTLIKEVRLTPSLVDASSNNKGNAEKDFPSSFLYDGDRVDNTPPPTGEYQKFEFPNPFILVCFFDKSIADGYVTLHPWQRDVNVELAEAKPTSKNPCKYVLLANNGSGKDKFIIAPFSVWFTLTKIRSRIIITTSSGVQLTSQTEPYIKDLCEKVNAHFGQEVYRIRQRYIKCILTGSEIRMFATDEKGKAEGYHPIDAHSEMAIIVNEGKSVTEDIHEALRRCTGFNYWIEVSSAGEPKGFLYKAVTDPRFGFKNKRITSYQCPHLNKNEIETDKLDLGEHSAFFRSKHLSLFTSIGGQSIIPLELIQQLLDNPPVHQFQHWPKRVGIDLAAGGDENVICITQGNYVVKEIWFRETDTTVAAMRIFQILHDEKIDKNSEHIYADDGGIGRGIIDQVNAFGYNINRVMNQWAALGDKKQFGNRGASNWFRVKRILEEKLFDISGLSKITLDQLSQRNYKQTLTGGRIFLEAKKEAKAHGRLSPDRADAFILSLTGLTVEDFMKNDNKEVETEARQRGQLLPTPDAVLNWYEDNETYSNYSDKIFDSKRSNVKRSNVKRSLKETLLKI